MGQKEFGEKEETAGLMVRVKNTIWGTGNFFIMNSSLFVLEGVILVVEMGVFGSVLIKKHYTVQRGFRQRRLFGTCSERRLETLIQLPILFVGRATILRPPSIITTSCS